MLRRHMIRRHLITSGFGLALLLSCLAALLQPSLVRAQPIALPTFEAMARKCGSGVATLTLAAVARTESGFEPLVVGDNSTRRSYTAKSLADAEAVAERLIAAGDNIDLGLMQINSRNLKELRLTVRAALDPCRSIASAASILTRSFVSERRTLDSQEALRDALSMYNTGNARSGYRNGYVHRVEAAATLLARKTFAANDAVVVRRSAAGPVRVIPSSWDVWAASPQQRVSAEADDGQIFVN